MYLVSRITKNSRDLKHIGFFIFIVCSLAGSIIFQMRYETHLRQTNWKQINLTYPLPHPAIIDKLSFGFRNALADMLWLEAIQALIDWYGKDPAYIQYFDAISTLDPYFQYPYIFGILILPRQGFFDETTRIAERGIRALPNDWEVPFYLGAQYHIIQRNFAKAAEYLKIASQRPGAPERVKIEYATYTARAGDFDAARSLVSTLYETAKNDFTKKEMRMLHDQLEVIGNIRTALAEYKRVMGRSATSVSQLVAAGFLKQSDFLDQFMITIDSSGRVLFDRKK